MGSISLMHGRFCQLHPIQTSSKRACCFNVLCVGYRRSADVCSISHASNIGVEPNHTCLHFRRPTYAAGLGMW